MNVIQSYDGKFNAYLLHNFFQRKSADFSVLKTKEFVSAGWFLLNKKIEHSYRNSHQECFMKKLFLKIS